MSARIVVWDLPVRLTHWLLVMLVATSWVTAREGALGWHKASGYGILWLVLFRTYWGFVGGSTARFSRFVRRPSAVAAYLRRWASTAPDAPSAGHNPAGGWSVVALLSLLALQVALGLFAVDEFGVDGGPLSSFVSFDGGRRIAGWHALTFNVLLTLIALHAAAVVGYLVIKRRNLVGPMITGRARSGAEPPAPDQPPAPVRTALIGFAASGLVVAWLALAA